MPTQSSAVLQSQRNWLWQLRFTLHMGELKSQWALCRPFLEQHLTQCQLLQCQCHGVLILCGNTKTSPSKSPKNLMKSSPVTILEEAVNVILPPAPTPQIPDTSYPLIIHHHQIFWEVVGLQRGPLGLVSTSELLLGRKSGSGLENRDYGRGDPLRWPQDTLIRKSWH
jgi:hypothetical protein